MYKRQVLDDIDHTFAPLLGAEWVYIKPGIRTCFLYEQNRMEEAARMLRTTLDCLSDKNKTEGRICVIVLQHSILWQTGNRKEADTVLTGLSNLVATEAQFFVPNFSILRRRAPT